MVLCAIWYHSYYLKNVKNTHGGVLLLMLKVTLFHGCFSRFFNCSSGTKSPSASHMQKGSRKFRTLENIISPISWRNSILSSYNRNHNVWMPLYSGFLSYYSKKLRKKSWKCFGLSQPILSEKIPAQSEQQRH